jgi:hypothetical protein
MRVTTVLAAGLLGAIAATATPVRAEDTKAPVAGPSAILQLLNSRESDSADTSLRESLRPDLTPVPAARLDAPVRMPDGSVRYGKTRVNVMVNNCPDDPNHEALVPPPPVRRIR